MPEINFNTPGKEIASGSGYSEWWNEYLSMNPF